MEVRMKLLAAPFWIASIAIISIANIAGQAQTPSGGPKPLNGVVFIDKGKVAEAFAKGGTLASAPDLVVLGAHRAAKGQVEVHDKETDVIYVIEGAATFVTGGKMEGGKVSRPNQWIGNSIAGGETHQLTKGDMIIVPAGTPHWFKDVSPQISYYVVKVVKS
jgi:mannose-6-phosphate isomerase-like protein (cupin superfamily)